MTTATTDRRASVVALGLLGLLAYVPLLAAHPGRMVADTKLYLYLDPGRLIADAPHTWDTRQFAGWVPHQTIAYLWPQGPWYWVFDQLRAPDWIAQRLWVGTLFVLAGLGLRRLALTLGLGAAGALAAGVVYQLSPYIVPYASRTSAMLLPWVGLGWLLHHVVLAAAGPPGWRRPAAVGLILASVGAVNVTALLMIAPAPALWLVTSVWQRDVPVRRALGVAVRVVVVGLPVSAWWMAMSLTQRSHGADVLSFSESLEAVSFTATSTEALRGLGYWLAYVRDPFGPTTTAITDLTSPPVLAAGTALLATGLAGLVLVTWRQRRFATVLVVAGVVLAVGVHPIAKPSPLMSWVAENSRSGPALALRSSTRALPMSIAGLALGTGALLTASGIRRRGRALLGAAAVVTLAVVNLPALFTGDLVDPVLSRDERVPDPWLAAAAALDGTSSEYRVLQLPGSEFGAYRWGYTSDPPLPGISERPLILRDLLPLGSPGVMDLIVSLDDRLQTSVLDPAALAPLARFLGADTVWLTNDLAHERYRTPRPIAVDELLTVPQPGLGEVRRFGTPAVDSPTIPMIDESLLDRGVLPPLAPVALVAVDDPVAIMRLAGDAVLLVGSGDGMVDAAAAGLLRGDELVWYAGHGLMPGSRPTMLVVTDSNRDRARHWRGTQDVVGLTENGGPGSDLLRADDKDVRLRVFDADLVEQQTTAFLETGLVVRATAYGEPFLYRPEDRPAMAVDGDPDTAWRVADRSDPIGHALAVSTTTGTLRLVQPGRGVPTREIASVRVEPAGHPPFEVALDDRSVTVPGQPIDVPAGVPVTIRITAVRSVDGTDSGPSAVGFAELGVGAHREIVAVPRVARSLMVPGVPVAVVLTRHRVDPLDRWRSDPEPILRRQFDLDARRSMDLRVTVRIDPRAHGRVLGQLFGEKTVADAHLTGSLAARGVHAVDGDPTTAWTSPFGPAVGLGLHLPLRPGVSLSSLSLLQPVDALHSIITRVRLDVDGQSIDLDVPAPDGTGSSRLTLPRPVRGSSLSLTILDTETRTTIDRRWGEEVALPVSLREITAEAIVPGRAGRPEPGCRTDLLELDGRAVGVAIDATDADALARGEQVELRHCTDTSVAVEAGRHLLESGDGSGLRVDRVVLAEPAAAAGTSRAVDLVPDRTRSSRRVDVPPCPTGCWLVFGEGHNPAWRATTDGSDLGTPVPVSGGFNGWWLGPSAQVRSVSLRWTAQRGVTVGLMVSAAAAGACLVLAAPLAIRRRRVAPVCPAPRFARLVPPSVQPLEAWSIAIMGTLAAAVIVSGEGALAFGPVAALIVVTRRPRVASYLGAILGVALAAAVTVRQYVSDFPADANWPIRFDDQHRWGLLAVTLLLAGSLRLTTRRRVDHD